MSDDPTKRDYRDRDRINVKEDYELQYWTKDDRGFVPFNGQRTHIWKFDANNPLLFENMIPTLTGHPLIELYKC